MRSILAGLRQLVLPWGARTAPRTVIGGEDPIAASLDQFSALVFYPFDDIVYLLGATVGIVPEVGELHIRLGSLGNVRASVLNASYHRGLDDFDVTLAGFGVDSLQIGNDARTITIGDPFTAPKDTDRLSLNGTELVVNNAEVAFSASIAADDSSTVATYNGATFQDIPGAPTATFVKKGTATRIKMEMHVTAYTSANFITPRFGLELDDGAGTVVDTEICGWRTSWTGREQFSGVAFCSDATMAPGTYTVTPRWRKAAGGAGDIGREAFDDISYCVSEVTEA